MLVKWIMAIFNIFKKKKPVKKEKKPKKERKPEKIEKAKEKVEEKVIEKPSVSAQPQRPKRKETGVAPLILKSVHVTEKATDLTKKNQYVFKVFPDSSKQEIKKAVEEVYGVDVLKVRQIRVKRKQRRLGRTFGWRKGYKKAIVTLKEGQRIEILPR